jgi:hypothetical protein
MDRAVTPLTTTCAVVALASAASQVAYWQGWPGFRADRGLLIVAALILVWLLLSLVAGRRYGRRAVWLLATAPVALMGLGLIPVVMVSCSILGRCL